MKSAIQFLVGMAQAISALGLYKEGHPARERALDLAFERLGLLQQEEPRPEFTFLGEEVVFCQRPLREMRSWDWGERLAAGGIQRLEILGPVSRAELEAFLDEALQRVAGRPPDTAEVRPTPATNIRYGVAGTRSEDRQVGGGRLPTAVLDLTLREESETVRWLHEELKAGRGLPLLEAEAVVRSLAVAMHGDQAFLLPLLRLKEFDQYTTTHSLNVAVLTMALAEHIGLGPKEVRAFGTAGLLHDVGKVRIPEQILNKPGRLTEEERRVMAAHPVEGARIILASEHPLDLAAVVAYEHHIKLNGGGYPRLAFSRKCHKASDLTHVCDVFDALRTDRPYRRCWPTEKVLGLIEEGAGQEFDPELAGAFVAMMRKWEGRVVELAAESQALPLANLEDGKKGDGGDLSATVPDPPGAAPRPGPASG